MNVKVISAVALMLIGCSALIISDDGNLDADIGTESSPVSSVSIYLDVFIADSGTSSTIWVYNGSHISMPARNDVKVTAISDEDAGLTVASSGTLSGTLTKVGRITVTYYRVDPTLGNLYGSFYIESIQPPAHPFYYSSADASLGVVTASRYDPQLGNVNFASGWEISPGTSVTVKAWPNDNVEFDGWENASGTIVSYSETYTFTMPSSNYSLTANFSAPTYRVNFAAGDGGTVSRSSISSVPYGSEITVSDNAVTIAGTTVTATPSSAAFQFTGWSVSDGQTVTSAMTITASFSAQTYTFAATSASVERGSVTGYVYVNGTQQSFNPASGRAVEAGATVGVRANPSPGYQFTSWTSGGTTVSTSSTYEFVMPSSNYSLTANFVSSEDPIVTWSNDNFNGRIDMLMQFQSSMENATHTMTMPLMSSSTADSITTWSDSGYLLSISVSYPSLTVTASVSYDDEDVASHTSNLGKWGAFLLSIDAASSTVTVTPVDTMTSFTDFTLMKNSYQVLDYSGITKSNAVTFINHADEGDGAHVRFSVAATSVFLDSYGVVLYNPSINLYDYFPQYDSLRLNLYSFALYGDSLTINGQTFDVDGSTITISYSGNDNPHVLPGIRPNADVKERTFELSNITITWESGHVFMEMVNDHFSIDLGAYEAGDMSISMAGLWYFSTMVYEPHPDVAKKISDWKTLPTASSEQMLLIFIGLLAVGFVAVSIHAKRSGRMGLADTLIIAGAAVTAFIMLG